jgi:signal transduction histidine kinase
MKPDLGAGGRDEEWKLSDLTVEASASDGACPSVLPRIETQQREFFSMVSHEFRTPLAGMEGTQFLLRQRLAEHADPHVHKYLEMQTACLRVMRELVDHVVALRGSENSASEVSWRWQRVAPLLRDIVDRVNATAERPRVILTAQTDCAIRIDEHLFRAALDNLISNALKFSSVEQRVDVACLRVGDQLEISVQDRGCGIPTEDCAHIFTPFFRGRNVGAVPGAGLGLAIVRRAVNQLGADVVFDSVEGCGTCFRLRFPRAMRPSARFAA